MGKTSDDVQREIEQHRVKMEQRITRLQERVRTDVSDAGNAMSDTVMERTHLREQVERHPLTTVAGAFGAGMVLGMASPSIGGADGPPNRSSGKSQSAGSGNLINQAIDSASAMLGGSMRDEIRDLMDNLFGKKDAAPAQTVRRAEEHQFQPPPDRSVDGFRSLDGKSESKREPDRQPETAGARPLMGNREFMERNR